MERPSFGIISSIFILIIYLLGFFNFTSDLIHSTVSLTLILTISLVIVIYYFRVSPPSQAVVDTVLGTDPIFGTSNNGRFFMKVWAHRGAALDAPENTLIAFQMSAEKGCRGIELDVMLTADDVPIVFHDDTLERLTGLQNAVRKMTWKQLSNIDISVKHPLREKFQNTYIAKLEDAVLQCLNNKQKILFDIKETNPKIVQVMLDFYEKYPDLDSQAACSSFYPQIVYLIRRQNPKIIGAIAWFPDTFANESYSAMNGCGFPRCENCVKYFIFRILDTIYEWFLPRFLYYIAGISAILLHKDVISGQLISEWRKKGIRVIAWTVNNPVEKQHFSRILKISYMTDTLIGDNSAHGNIKRIQF